MFCSAKKLKIKKSVQNAELKSVLASFVNSIWIFVTEKKNKKKNTKLISYKGSRQIIVVPEIYFSRLYWLADCLICLTWLPRDGMECTSLDKRLSTDMGKQRLRTHSRGGVG